MTGRRWSAYPLMRTVLRAGSATARKAGARLLDEVASRIGSSVPSDEAFFRICRSDGAEFRSTKDLGAYFRNRTGPVFLMAACQHPGVPLGASFAHGIPAVVAAAERACVHTFDLLGSGDVSLGDMIDWHRDFKSGYRWSPSTHYTRIRIPVGTADIKVPWELSRFSHAIPLGQAYRLTGDEKYAREFARQVSDWIRANRPKFGVNWACTMDVAIRACNWAAGFFLMRNSPALDDDFLLMFLKSLYQHGRHIRANLENSAAVTANHYLANLAGLVSLGLLFPEFREAAEWRAFGTAELITEMEKQVYRDGCGFEASTCYHRLSLELFFYPVLLVVMNSEGFDGTNYREIAERCFGAAFTNRLRRMFDAVRLLLRPDGTMPQIGDNDSGRLHLYAERPVLDMRYLLCLGAVFFREPRFRIVEFGWCEETLWVYGKRGREIWDQLEETSLASIESAALTDAGWYVMRKGDTCIVVSCGPNGQAGFGGHAHNDKLSVVLTLQGRELLVDPGTFVYTRDPDARNRFRSTACHNTVTVNGREQNRLDRGLFLLPDASRAECLAWQTGEGHDRFAGEHFGFSSEGFVHRREVDFDKESGTVRIRDSVRGENPTSVAWFHFPPGLRPEMGQDGVRFPGGAHISFRFHRAIELKEDWYSEAYGLKERSLCLAVSFSDKLETTICHE